MLALQKTMITIEICHRSNFPAGCTYTVLNGSCNIKQSKIRFIVCSTVQTKQERLSRTPTVRLSGDVWATVKKFEQVLRGNGARGFPSTQVWLGGRWAVVGVPHVATWTVARQTDTTENITFLQLRMRVVTKTSTCEL